MVLRRCGRSEEARRTNGELDTRNHGFDCRCQTSRRGHVIVDGGRESGSGDGRRSRRKKRVVPSHRSIARRNEVYSHVHSVDSLLDESRGQIDSVVTNSAGIVGMVEEASRYATEVTSAASQQAASLGEVNGAMSELVRVAESLQNETEQCEGVMMNQ